MWTDLVQFGLCACVLHVYLLLLSLPGYMFSYPFPWPFLFLHSCFLLGLCWDNDCLYSWRCDSAAPQACSWARWRCVLPLTQERNYPVVSPWGLQQGGELQHVLAGQNAFWLQKEVASVWIAVSILKYFPTEVVVGSSAGVKYCIFFLINWIWLKKVSTVNKVEK